jgi:hypothetical protein
MNHILDIIYNVNRRFAGDDLKHYFNEVMQAPNAYAMYHNPRHLLHVLWEAYDAGVQMGLDPVELRDLCIAALMHDYGHLGQPGDDQVNIDRALAALDRLILDEDRPRIENIRQYILATKFPYTNEKFSDNHLLLRDADQSQTFSVAWIHSTLHGLGKELGLTYEQMLRLQRPYLEKLKFCTLWGKNKFEPQIPAKLNDIDRIIGTLKPRVEEAVTA